MRETGLRKIFDKTQGHCHFCGDPVVFEQYGKNADGSWEKDHITQRAKGGSGTADNCLPVCTRCNRLRWHRTGDEIREVIFLGLIANKEIKKSSPIGRILLVLRELRIKENQRRRRTRNRHADV